ncbi:MAG: DUF2281 domain-containing protein [Chloroflexi bacterium]|nr:DUF2281 domain-containing protein [Chloroflexota bacterium]
MRATGEPRRRQIIKEMVDGLDALPDERLEEVRDFVEFLRRKAGGPKRGSPEALLQLLGSWDGPSGELDRLVEEIYEARHQEEED